MQILAVDGGDQRLASHFARLREAGFKITQAATFETAREIMFGGTHIDLLITAVRLKAYNGLHLVAYTQSFCEGTAAIVIDGQGADPVNEFEARRLGADYLAGPIGSEEFDIRVQDAVVSHLSPSARTATSLPARHQSSERA